MEIIKLKNSSSKQTGTTSPNEIATSQLGIADANNGDFNLKSETVAQQVLTELAKLILNEQTSSEENAN